MLALKLSLATNVEEINDRTAFLLLKNEWNDLVESTGGEPFYRHEFIRIWIESFAASAKLRILILRDSARRLMAIMPLIEQSTFFCGFPVRQLISPANSHSCRFDLIAQDGASASKEFFSYLSANRNWDLLQILDVPEDGKMPHLYKAAEQANYPVGAWESQHSPYLNLPDTYPKLMERFSSVFKTTLRRRWKRLEKLGKISFEVVTGGTELQQCLKECYAVEESSWKGRQGTAITQSTNTYNFYNKLAHASAHEKYLSLFLLRLDGKLIAFQFNLNYNSTVYTLKLGYDENYKECSPGLVLLNEIIKYCIEQKVQKCDFLGDETDWKVKWSNNLTHHKWLYIFQKNRFGNVLHKTKFSLIPYAKQMFTALKG